MTTTTSSSSSRSMAAARRFLLLSSLVLAPAQSILQTATIEILLPGVPTPLSLLASQASFGPSLVSYSDGHHHASSVSSNRPAGVGLIPSTPPDDDPFLCNEFYGWTSYTNNNNNNNADGKSYNNAAILVPRGQCSFERKALSAQRLGASAIIIYGSLSSRYSLNVTNTTNDNDGTSNNDAYKRTDYTLNDVIWPTDKQDYDCTNGRALLPENVFEQFNFVTSPGGYVAESNDEYLIGNSENNVCVKYAAANNNDGGGDDTSSSSFVSSCESQRCLITGKNITTDKGSDGTGIQYEACCAWDFAIWLYQDTTLSMAEEKEVTIPAVYITMQQATEFMDLINGVNNENNNGNGNGDPIVLSMYARDRPSVNSSAIIIWALGVFVAWLASYMSSSDYRGYAKAIQRKSQFVARAGGAAGAVAVAASSDERPPSSPGRGGARSRSQSRERNAATTAAGAASSPTSENGERTIYREGEDDTAAAVITNRSVQPHHHHQEEESLELDASHALGFIVMASTSLLVLFYFKIFNVVKIFYAFGCSGAFAQVVLYPLLTRICRKLRWRGPMRPMECLSEENATRAALNGGCKGKILMCLYSFFGPITFLDVMANVIAYAVGGTWLYIAFTVLHPESHLFYWVVQDVFGACMCITFLGTIKINAIRVAAILLTVAFFYDIFFVFVTPLLTKHGESIMVNVATSGGPPKADPSWCEKYPSSEECRGGEPLPMLFAIPRIGDYQGGSSMLGLGDIVLPGLLLSFASRFDEAKRLMGLVSGGAGRVRNGGGGISINKSSCNICCGCGQGGYFGPVVVAYAVGLAMANAAVYLMQMGQPALLYLVPCCLGTFVFIARKNGELNDIWENPRAIRAADALLFGGRIEVEDEDDVRTSSLLMNEGAEMT